MAVSFGNFRIIGAHFILIPKSFLIHHSNVDLFLVKQGQRPKFFDNLLALGGII